MNLRSFVRDVADFPRPGILFRDLGPLLGDAEAFAVAVDALAAPFAAGGIDCVAGIEARGFIFGAAVARRLGCGFVPLRKPGKLPGARIGIDYALEYGSDRLEVAADALAPNRRVLIVDDVLATGGTLAAAAQLVTRAAALPVGAAVAVELGALGGRARWPCDAPLHALIRID